MKAKTPALLLQQRLADCRKDRKNKRGCETWSLKEQNESLEKQLENLEHMVKSLVAKD